MASGRRVARENLPYEGLMPPGTFGWTAGKGRATHGKTLAASDFMTLPQITPSKRLAATVDGLFIKVSYRFRL